MNDNEDLIECLRHESEFLAAGGYYSQAKLIDEAVETIIGLQHALGRCVDGGSYDMAREGISTPRSIL